MKEKKSDIALVVPSIRKDSFERFIQEWTPTGIFDRVDLILIEDNPIKMFECPIARHHFCWKDIDSDLKEIAWIIPRRSDTVRSYGYYVAWREGYQYLMTLDDDCYPAPGYESLDQLHLSMLTERSQWFNTLNSVRPRGVPYKNIGKRDVYINHGIWQGVLDYDAPQQLVNPIPETYTHDNRIVPTGAYFPFCGMNVMWSREAIPLSYHLLMGNIRHLDTELQPLPFDRFGDIWSGIIAKKICDTLEMAISTGTPYIHHDRASDPFKNLRKEANGIEVNEWFWNAIDKINLRKYYPTVLDRYQAIGMRIKEEIGGEFGPYWRTLGEAMILWADLLNRKIP